MIPLTRLQKEIMEEFYACDPLKVIYNKRQRVQLWKIAIAKGKIDNFQFLKEQCPALAHQIEKSYESGNNIQSAVLVSVFMRKRLRICLSFLFLQIALTTKLLYPTM